MPKLLYVKKALPFVILVFLIPVYCALQIGKVAPNVHFAGQRLNTQDTAQIKLIVDSKIKDFEKEPLIININDKQISIPYKDSGVQINGEESLRVISVWGNSKNLFADSKLKLKSLVVPVELTPVYTVDFSKFLEKLETEIAPLEKKTVNASIKFAKGKFQITPAVSGEVADRSAIISSFKSNIDSLSAQTINVQTFRQDPLIAGAQAEQALGKIQSLAGQKITLVYSSDKWSLSGTSLLDIVQFSPKGYERDHLVATTINPQAPIYLRNFTFDEAEPILLGVSVNEDSLGTFVAGIAREIDTPTVDATLRFENGKIYDFKPAVDGRKLDQQLTKSILAEKVSVDNPNTEREININLPVSVSKAKIQNDEIGNLGIRELIGRGTSYFAGSIPNRVYNVGLGASRINGVLVKPGDTFSFNQTVGDISAATGYKQAYVISAGRTQLDDGGGICQVSTTVFRAALNSGLHIEKRTAHAYRVGYYEQRGFKAGLDATVWSPSVDLVFRNDTPNHILVQTVINKSTSKLEVDIYGTSDGRKVEISQPVISARSPAPEARYQDDPSLPRGQTKQVDFAAEGAKVVFSRKVYKGDDLIIDESFKSNYRPWQAVFLVGTGG